MPKILGFKSNGDQPLRVVNKSATRAELTIYAPIGESLWGDSISAKQFSDTLNSLDSAVNEITVRINSPGGDVFDGIAIYNRLKQHKAKIIVHIDGLAASIASVIALAGDEIVIGDGALYMIHLPWTFSMGNRMDLENTINRLMDAEEQMIGIYAKRTKMDRTEIRKMLESETWLDADQAIDKGFVDKKADQSMPIAASALKNPWITKAPKNFNSDTKAVDSAISALKKKIGQKIAR